MKPELYVMTSVCHKHIELIDTDMSDMVGKGMICLVCGCHEDSIARGYAKVVGK